MAKRSATPVNPFGLRVRDYFYTEDEIDQIVAAGGPLPEGDIECARTKPDGSGLETVILSRHAALAARLQGAALAYSASCRTDQQPTPAQLARAMKRIEDAAVALQQAIATMGAHFSPGLVRAVVGALHDLAKQEAENRSDFYPRNINSEVLAKEFVHDALLGDALLGVERLRRWAEHAHRLEAEKSATPREGRNVGNRALAGFVGNLLDMYRDIFERTPSASVGAPGRANAGQPGGLTIRFLETCLRPVLGDDTPSNNALRHRIREWRSQS